jgi:hypothetical protein
MSSLIEELQRDALNGNVDVSHLLRKAYTVAVKLKLEKFEAWCQYELNGYPKGVEIPEYRHIHGQVKAFNPYNGVWHIMRFDECPELGEQVSNRQELSPIGQLQDLVAKADGSAMMAVILPMPVQHLLLRGDEAFNQVRLEFGRSTVVKMLDAIRNKILEWSLKLEQQGIVGEGMSFSIGEKKAAVENSERLQSIINIGTMVNSTIQQGSPESRLEAAN